MGGYSSDISSAATMSRPKAMRKALAAALVKAQRLKWGATFLFVLAGVASPLSSKVPNGNTATACASERSASLYVQSTFKL